jgi:hypothetical protein
MSEETTSFGPWLEGLKSSDDATFQAAAQALWDRLVHQIKAHAGKKLGGFPRRAFSETDVANSGFNSFCQGVLESRFPKLDNKDDLWKVLGTILARKARDRVRAETTEKRRDKDKGPTRGDSALTKPGDSASGGGFDGVEGPATRPDNGLEFEEMLSYLDRHDPILRDMALLIALSMTNKEIANKLDMSLRSVERKRQLLGELLKSYYETGS